MNCTKIEKLLPLYVEGDLSTAEATQVGAHLSACDDCRRLEKEFAVSQQRLRNFAVPEFGAEFYEQLRGAVMREISSKPAARPAAFRTLRAFFTMRPALAASLVTLALFCGLSFALYRSLIKDETGLAAIEIGMANFSFDMPAAFDEVRPVSNEVTSNGAGRTSFVARNASRRRSVRAAVERAPTEASSAASSTRTIDSAGSNAERAGTQTGGTSADEASRQVVARMDIQTGDPNIRIIWLGRKTSD
ncbi:MAG TPA: zf-HC2 domain-containing protein [Pyrinomonadaceae bacterium]|jgi:hypothetical protein